MTLLDPRLPPDVHAWDRLHRPVWLYDPETHRGLYANPAAVELWGAADLAELVRRDFSSLSPAIRTRTRRVAAKTAEGEVVDELWTFYPNGKPVTLQTVISAFALSDGRSVLLFEAASTSLNEAERRAAAALLHTSSLITLFDLEGRTLFANFASLAAYGVAGRSFIDRFCDPRHGEITLERVQGGEVVAELCQVTTIDGERAHHLDARQVLDPVTGEASVLLSERDVTAQVNAEKALVAARERAEVAIAKERFLTQMSHDLRTPLNSVLGFADLMKSGPLDPIQAGYLVRITQAGESLISAINDMIALSEQDLGPASPSTSPEPPSPEAAGTAEDLDGPPALTILYADDNESNRTLIQTILQSQGHGCDLVCDGAEAVEAVRGGLYDLVLMDIQMPVMDGIDAARAIRDLPGQVGAVPIIAHTANTLADQIQAYAAAGMQDCLPKPVKMVELFTKVGQWARPSPKSAPALTASSV